MRRPAVNLVNRADISPRRRSILNRAVSLLPHQDNKNDDEAERAELLAEDQRTKGAQFSTPRNFSSPRSVTSDISSPQKEHFQGCLKLYAENKINKDNAWNLHLIDFMSSMLKKHDTRMENLQMATTTLDASARIYSFRVDAIHHDVLKMAGGLSKAVQNKRGKKDDENKENENPNDESTDEDGTQKKKGKRKKGPKGSVATNIKSQLNTEIDVNECIDPFFAQLAAKSGDMTSSNRAFNSALPIDDLTLEIILRSDVPFLHASDPSDEKLDTENLEMFNIDHKLFKIIKEDNYICEAFNGFSISDWDPDDEEAKMKLNSSNCFNNLNISHQTMAFDINADVEPLPNDNFITGFDNDQNDPIESDEDEHAVINHALKRDKAKMITRLTDMRPSSQSDGYLEYSYCSAVVGAWAGPSHWKLKNNINRGSRLPEKSQTITTVIAKKAPSRKKRQLDFIGEGMSFNRLSQQYPEYATVIPSKIMIGRKVLSQSVTWNEKKFKTPIDRGFNMLHFKKFYLQQTVMLSTNSGEIESDNKLPERISDVVDYDYQNENDTSYCPASQPNDYADLPGDECNKDDVHNQTDIFNEGLEMVEPPPKVAKIFIPYALRAKKVDMKQLKNASWKILTSKPESENKENEEGEIQINKTEFSTLYKILPNRLSNNMKESLSISLSLLAILHLANEKGLRLQNNKDFTDFEICGLNDVM